MIIDLVKLAGRVSGKWSLAAFGIVALIVYLASQRGRVPPIAWVIVILVGLILDSDSFPAVTIIVESDKAATIPGTVRGGDGGATGHAPR